MVAKALFTPEVQIQRSSLRVRLWRPWGFFIILGLIMPPPPLVRLPISYIVEPHLVLDVLHLLPIFCVEVLFPEPQNVEPASKEEISCWKHKRYVKEQVAEIGLVLVVEPVVEVFRGVDAPGHPDPHQREQTPVWVVGGRAEVEEDQPAVGEHVEHWEQGIAQHKLAHGLGRHFKECHLATFFLTFCSL